MNERLKEIIDEYCDALDVLNKYTAGSDFDYETNHRLFTTSDSIIAKGLFDFADALGMKPEKVSDRTRVGDNGDISVKYRINYRGYEFYDYVTVGNLSEVVK